MRHKHKGNKNHPINGSFEKNVLLEIYRAFSRDEAVAFLKKEITNLQLEKGKDAMYIAELEDQIKSYETLSPEEKEHWKWRRKHHTDLQQLEKNVQSLTEQLKKAKKNTDDWQKKYFASIVQTNSVTQ